MRNENGNLIWRSPLNCYAADPITGLMMGQHIISSGINTQLISIDADILLGCNDGLIRSNSIAF
jgi:hypothetical protein